MFSASGGGGEERGEGVFSTLGGGVFSTSGDVQYTGVFNINQRLLSNCSPT